jgi:hypothetical protein
LSRLLYCSSLARPGQSYLMPTRDNRSISEITDSLELIARQRGFLRCLHADRDAGEIAGCVQRLKQSIDSFLVGGDRSTLEIELCLNDVAGGKRHDDRDQSRGASEDMAILVRF